MLQISFSNVDRIIGNQVEGKKKQFWTKKKVGGVYVSITPCEIPCIMIVVKPSHELFVHSLE
jgi:hypothetical protein